MKKIIFLVVFLLSVVSLCWAEELEKTEKEANLKNFMITATGEALKSIALVDGGPFGAVVVKDGEIVGIGHDETLEKRDLTCHAEMQAIRNACQNLNTYNLTGCELYTNCYPCPMCLSATILANIKKVYYGNTKEDAAYIGFNYDNIYKFIEKGCKNKEVLDLEQQMRNSTIVIFKEYVEQERENRFK